MQKDYLNRAIRRSCHKKEKCFPLDVEHNCVQCRADMEADLSESEYLDMMARNERNDMTEW